MKTVNKLLSRILQHAMTSYSYLVNGSYNYNSRDEWSIFFSDDDTYNHFPESQTQFQCSCAKYSISIGILSKYTLRR